MTIQIIDVIRMTDEFGVPTRHRAATIAIDDGVTTYRLNVGNLSDKGDLQAELEANEARYLAVARKRNQVFDVDDLPEEITIPSLRRTLLVEINVLRRALVLPDKTEDEVKIEMKGDLAGNVDLGGRKSS